MNIQQLSLLETELKDFPITKLFIQTLANALSPAKFTPQWSNAISGVQTLRAQFTKVGKLIFYSVTIIPSTTISWATNSPVLILPVDPQNENTNKYGTNGQFQGMHVMKHGPQGSSTMTTVDGYLIPYNSGIRTRVAFGTVSPATGDVVHIDGYYWTE